MSISKEARARLKINQLLEESGWRFFDNTAGRANIVPEPQVETTQTAINQVWGRTDEYPSDLEQGTPLLAIFGL